MEVGGLPLHPLVVHAAVVFTPLAALTALGYALVGRWRERLRLPTAVLAVAATLSVVAAFLSGNSLLDTVPQLARRPLVETHRERAVLLLWTTLGYAVVAGAALWWHDRAGTPRAVLRVVLALVAVAVLVLVVLTGDAGTRAVWGAVTGS